MKQRWHPLLLLSLLSPVILQGEMHSTEGRQEWVLDENYTGKYPQHFQRLKNEVPLWMRQTMIDVAVSLGMDFREGWSFPLAINFSDDAPSGVENALAYVRLYQKGDGFAQVLTINLTAYEDTKFDLREVLAHELVHAMINDAMGGNAAAKLPVWLHEGLATYGSGEGEEMAQNYVLQLTDYKDEAFLNGLEGPHAPLDYAEDYWAIESIRKTHGITSLQNFVREIIRRQGDIPGALQYTCFVDWETFQKNARDYALSEITRIRRSYRVLGKEY